MSPKDKKAIKEFLTKDNERFSLIRMGFFTNIDEEVEFICQRCETRSDESFGDWKKRILTTFYTDKHFSSFCCGHINDWFFEKAVKSLLQADLHEIFLKSEKTQTDIFLAPEKDTLSYALSPEVFEALYGSNFTPSVSLPSTLELDSFCRELLKKTFPLEESYVVNALEGNSNFYWGKVYSRLLPMASGYSYHISGHYSSDCVHDIWSDTCCTLNAAVVGQKLKRPTLAKDIISYAVGIIKNKNRELLRSNSKMPKTSIDSVSYKLTDEEDDHYFNNLETIPSNFPSQDEKISTYIDVRDPEAVRNYMVVVLYNNEHPLHKKLVEGYEDKVKLLFEHYIDDLSYEDMVTKHYGKVSEEDVVRIAARIRQDVKRVKERLIKRFDLIVNNRNHE